MKLICFPHAGGFSLYYGFLRKYTYQNIDKIPVFDYPRSSFQPTGTPEDFRCYVNAAAEYIRKNITEGEPYLLFGHSMGAFIACEAGLIMQNTFGQAPAGVIVSGQNPPYAVHMGKHTEMPSDLYAFAKKLGGVPQKILDNPQMCEKLIRFAEADLQAVSTYVPTMPAGAERLACGMLIRGADDFIVDPEYVGDWDKTFRRMDSDNVLEGDHFYFNQQPEALSALIDRFAGSLMPR